MREAMLIVHFIGLAMGIGTSFAFMFLAMASKKMEPGEVTKFRLNSFALGRMGQVGLTLLVVSGLYLMTPYWKSLTSRPLLMTKLGLVIVLGGLIGAISATARKAQLGDPDIHFKKIDPLGRLTMLVGLAILVLAVLIFR